MIANDHLITAIMPVKAYHRPFLRQAVGSLLEQTSPHWRAIIVHMPGADAELRAALTPAVDDSRITLVAQRGRKLAGALNTGMRAADTELTAILFADDMWAPNAVEVLNRTIANRPEVDFFHSSRRFIDDAGSPISDVYEAPAEVTLDMFVDGGPVKHLLCWRVAPALAIGGIDESLDSVGPDDYDFPWAMMEAGARFAAVPECLYIYRDHRSCYRLTTHLPLRTHLKGIERILRKHGVAEEAIARRLAEARGTYLRQCLYASWPEAWWGCLRRRDPAQGWREGYR